MSPIPLRLCLSYIHIILYVYAEPNWTKVPFYTSVDIIEFDVSNFPQSLPFFCRWVASKFFVWYRFIIIILLKIFSCILYFVKIRMKYTVSSIKFCIEFGDVFYSEIIYYFSDCYACCLPIWIFRNYILVKGWFISSRNHLSFKPPFKRNLSELS